MKAILDIAYSGWQESGRLDELERKVFYFRNAVTVVVLERFIR